MAPTSTLAVRAFRARRKSAGIPDRDRRKQKEYKRDHKRAKAREDRPFIGCDGEGCGKDAHGRQLYTLFRMGGRELFDDGRHLGTEKLLNFICDEPAGTILVGFAFGYDVTMILRDLSPGQQKRLFEPRNFGEGHSPYVWFKNFDIEYLPRNYIKVKRVIIERGTDGTERRIPVKGSQRTIYETFGFFQKPFIKVMAEFDVGSEASRKTVAENKSRRSEFVNITDEERRYCALECEMLVELMEKLRSYCHAAGIVPRTWNGAGKLANALHRLHETTTAVEAKAVVPKQVLDLANMAYYGGRFEITRTGKIEGNVYEYDLRSAYPDAMRRLPCLVHGTWEPVSGKELQSLSRGMDRRDGPDPLFVAVCTYKACGDQPDAGRLGGLPLRSKEGHLYWPKQGGGVFWSCEISSAIKLGFEVKYKSGWLYRKACDCKPFDWVEILYEYRKSIGSVGPGYPIKLGINALYGLIAQRIGAGKFANMVWAGLITSLTRSKINDAIALNPGRILMVATDAVYSLDPLGGLDCGDRLGQWEAVELDGLFIVQPGLYWCPAKRKKKSRGLSGRFFEEAGRTESFEEAWKYYQAQENSKQLTDFPAVPVPVPGFIGLKLAISRNKPMLAGTWVNETREISFDYRNKRQGHSWDGGAIVTNIKSGHPGLVSLPHRDFLKAGGQEPWEAARLMLEEQPDYIDLGIPFKD